MNELFVLFISLSLSGLLMAIVLLLLKLPLKHKLSSIWWYYIWFIVLLRLLIPFSPNTNLVDGFFEHVEAEWNMQIQREESNILPELKTEDTFFFYGALWIIISVLLLLRKGYVYFRCTKAIKKNCVKIENTQLLAEFERIKKEMGVKIRIPLYYNRFLMSPMLLGAVSPIIVIPEELADILGFRYIIMHELIHYKRRDFLYKWFMETVLCLHWFNPFLYWVRKEIYKECELSCDESIVRKLDVKEKREYGETLLSSIKAEKLNTRNIAFLSMSEDGKLMKERLGLIMKNHKKAMPTIILTAVLSIFLLCGALFAGSYADDKTLPQEKIPVSENEDISAVLNESMITQEAHEQDEWIKIDAAGENENSEEIYIPSEDSRNVENANVYVPSYLRN